MDLLILAAGMGSRFGGLKQLTPIDNENNFIIDYSIFDAIRCGFDKVVFIIKKENYELFRDTIGRKIENKVKVEYVFQTNDNVPEKYVIPAKRQKPLGTAHAILCAKDVIKNNFAVINADDFYGLDAFRTVAQFLKSDFKTTDFTIVNFGAQNTLSQNGEVKRGICKIENGLLKNIDESLIKQDGNGNIVAKSLVNDGDWHSIDGDTPVSMNLFGFSPKLFELLEGDFVEFLETNQENLESVEFLLPTAVTKHIKSGEITVSALQTDAIWKGITYKEDLDEVKTFITALKDNSYYNMTLWD